MKRIICPVCMGTGKMTGGDCIQCEGKGEIIINED